MPFLNGSLIKQGLQDNVYNYSIATEACKKARPLSLSCAPKFLNFMSHTDVESYSAIVSGYFNSGCTIKKDCRSWNILISWFIRNQRTQEALNHFLKMRQGNVRPDSFTYSILFPYCDLGFGRQLHADVVRTCLALDSCLWTNLMRMYAEVGVIEDARKVFDEMPMRDLIAWNAFLSCYSLRAMHGVCWSLFQELYREGISGDEYTYAIVLNGLVSNLQFDEAVKVHSMVVKVGFVSDLYIGTALMELYAKCGLVKSAMRLFKEMPEQDVVSWTTFVTCVGQSGLVDDAIKLLSDMRIAGVQPNYFTFGGLLSACSNANALQRGKQLHGLVLKHGLESHMVVGSAISDLYAKCSEMQYAFKIFQSLPKKDVVSWNGIICGYAQNGEGMKALQLFDEMLQQRPTVIAPNDVTFTGVLSACSHRGLVREGCDHFIDMIRKYSIKPKPEHVTCMVDLLGRAGLVEEAEALVLGMAFKPDAIMWGAFLAACKLHENTKMGLRVREHLLNIEPFTSSSYVLLANSYTSIGEWNEANNVRGIISERGLKKTRGCSWVETGGFMHSFVSGDKFYLETDQLLELLHTVYLEMDDLTRCSTVFL